MSAHERLLKQLRQRDDGWPEYTSGLSEIEQYQNATATYFSACDYDEAWIWAEDLALIRRVLRRGSDYGDLAAQFKGGRGADYWELIYALARIHRQTEFLLDMEAPA
jgi:hypothetical protein